VSPGDDSAGKGKGLCPSGARGLDQLLEFKSRFWVLSLLGMSGFRNGISLVFCHLCIW